MDTNKSLLTLSFLTLLNFFLQSAPLFYTSVGADPNDDLSFQAALSGYQIQEEDFDDPTEFSHGAITMVSVWEEPTLISHFQVQGHPKQKVFGVAFLELAEFMERCMAVQF